MVLDPLRMGLVGLPLHLLQYPGQVVSTRVLLALLVVVLVECDLLAVPLERFLPVPEHAHNVHWLQLFLLDRVFVELC